MVVAVTDACVFIDLMELEITAEFFDLKIEIHTTIDVWNELFADQQEILKAYKSVGKLTVHVLDQGDHEQMSPFNFPRSLSDPDKSVIYLAHKIKAMVLSSDGPVRRFAKGISIERHGMFWILDELVDQKIITKTEAAQKLQLLTETNLMYLNNRKLQKEIEKRMGEWDDGDD